MLKNTEKILDSELADHVFQDIDLANLYGGSDPRRYGLVNKALKAGELIRLKRGLYTLPFKYQKKYFNLYSIANHIVPYSFVTAEAALQFHQWIPERVFQITSIAAFGRSTEFSNSLGQFIYFVPPVTFPEAYFTGVEVTTIENSLTWMATPLRALIDYILWHKIDNANIDFLMRSLRIEEESLNTIKKGDIEELIPVYKSRRVVVFLKNLLKEIKV